jgi:hypothetical protein
MSKKDWNKELSALKSDDYAFNVPYHATLGEAADIAVFVRANHKADKKSGRPGLADGDLPIAIADEIDSLVENVMWAQREYRKAMSPKADTTKLDRARFLIDEMGAVLEYFLDDGVEDENDQRFAKLVAAHKDAPDSPDALAIELDEYATIADMHRKKIDGLGGFDATMIDEARKLSKDLLAMTPNEPVSSEATAALAKRNRFLQLLDQRVRRVRKVARYVFRHHPETARGIVSLYERKRRLEAKRSATRKKNAQPAPAPTP